MLIFGRTDFYPGLFHHLAADNLNSMTTFRTFRRRMSGMALSAIPALALEAFCPRDSNARKQ
jgi:hypothetical protein